MAVTTVLTPAKSTDATWVAATHTRNFLKNDPIVDWLIHFGEELDEETGVWRQKREAWHGYHPDNHHSHGPYIHEADFLKFIRAKGQEFESSVLDLIKKILEEKQLGAITLIADRSKCVFEFEYKEKTILAMQAGSPVIYQAVLWDEAHKTLGIADLLIRSDVLNEIVPNSISLVESQQRALGLGRDFHYVAADVKFSTNHLDREGELGNDKASVKAQLAIYNAALGEMQGYMPPCAYVIGRGWDKGKDRGDSCLDRIGKFPISQKNSKKGAPNIDWLQKALDACNWIRRVRSEGHEWIGKHVEIPELRPNLGNDKDAPYRKAKKEISSATGELTALWQVGYACRQDCIERTKITDWKDPLCSAKDFDIYDVYKPWLDRILQINRGENGPLVLPEKVIADEATWKTPAPVEFFVDFETVNDMDDDFSKMPLKNGNTRIFMIGCGHIENGEWKFECFIADELTDECELKAITDWSDHMKAVQLRLDSKAESRKPEALAPATPSLFDEPPQPSSQATEQPSNSPIVFHWSPAEKSTFLTQYESAKDRHPGKLPTVNFYDFLANVIKPKGREDCVVVKGAFAFGLKAIGKALHNHGLIETNWADGPTDGLGAMTGGWWCYDQLKSQGKPIIEIKTSTGRELFREIRDYNEVDCKVMYETINYLRNNH